MPFNNPSAVFHKIYEGLNPEQKKAVDALEGPVMVIAGPGTGKTQILSARIGKILQDTDTLPENILCLTYTDAGVLAMRKRLQAFMGPDAFKVQVYTFHAFCNDVIQENLSLFEKNILDPISELERIDLFRELIDSFPKNHPLKRYRGDVYYEMGAMQQLFSIMKREGWTPAFINDRINAYLDDIPSRETFQYQRAYKQFKKGDLKQSMIEEAREKMEKLRAAVGEFDRFQELMRRHNRYDFDDMINWVIRAFEEHKLLLTAYQEQFQYVLVDEFQDTSGTQNRLVELLISYWDLPNIFVVGDDDQSIYRFQGANVENMENFAARYANDLLTVVLTRNYRSTQPILDTAKSVIDRNEERLVRKIDGLSKELTAANPAMQALAMPPIVREYNNPREEMIHLALETERLLQAGVAPGDIAIIYKENKYGEELSQFLKQRNIPAFSKRQRNVLDIPLAKQILLLLEYLALEHDVPFGGDECLFEILHFKWWGIPPLEIAKLSHEVSDRRFGQRPISLRELVAEKAEAIPADLFHRPSSNGLQKASQALESLIGDVSNCTLINLLENCLQKTGLLEWIMQQPDKHWQLEVVSALFDFIREEARKDAGLTLKKLVDIFRLMRQEGVRLPLVQFLGTETGVNLLTAHGSKGLEYAYVFLAGCNAGNWEKKRKPGGGYSFPDTLFQTLPAHHEEEELRRLFYVAVTRAKQQLYLSYSRCKADGAEWEASLFLEEIRSAHQLPYEKIQLDAPVLAAFALISMQTQKPPEIDSAEEAFITPLLEKFVMNVTALNNYLKCPLQFYYQNLVRVPSGKSEATEFGSAAHFALQQLFEKMQADNAFPDTAFFIRQFEWYMHRHRENFTAEQFKRRMEYGQTILAAYYDRYVNEWNKIVAVEKTIRNVVVQGIPLKGKLDKLEFDGLSVNVVDYKTGDPEKARTRLKGPDEKQPNGGDYWRQAVFYKILVDHFPLKNWKVVSTEFDFIEPDKKQQYRKEKILITPEDITTVTEQIKTVWQKIQARDFYTGCGESDCHWCEFVKNAQLSKTL